MQRLADLFKAIFIGTRFYGLLASVILLFILSFLYPVLFFVAQLCLLVSLALAAIDFIVLFAKRHPVTAKRNINPKMSNGDRNDISWTIENHYPFTAHLTMLDEFPEPWEIRDFEASFKLSAQSGIIRNFSYQPKNRGEYKFGDIQIFIRSPLQLMVRRSTVKAGSIVKVYPSFVWLRKFEFLSHVSEPGNLGFKQVRKTGRSLEFEQIREYVHGDDVRSVNWRATGRKGGQLMINSYTDEKSQQIYCIIDKGRTMKMAFDGMSLLDYAVNASLAMSFVTISKKDRAGVIGFGDQSGDFLAAGHNVSQMSGILNTLYNLQTRFLESDFAFLYKVIKTRITQRSLLILFTNFESLTAMNRQLPYMRSISRKHLLLVVFFENTSLTSLASTEADSVEKLYEKVIAEKFMLEKKLIVKELHRYGISALLTTPEKLSVDVVNRYLEIKARREI